MKSKILTALLAALIAMCLWVYVITVERPESEKTFYNVPVVLDGETVLWDRGMMITSNSNETVTLTLSGKRSDLKNLKSSDIAAVVNLSRITQAGEKNASYSVSIPGDSSIEVVKRKPDTISLSVTEWASKEIPVDVTYVNRVPEGYDADWESETKDFETVTVTGPRDIVKQIEIAKVTIDMTNRTETFSESFRYALCDADKNPIEDVSSVRTDHGEIQVSLRIQQLKEVKLTYTIVDGGGLTAENVKVTLEHETITVAGSAAALVDLDEINLGEVDLGKLTEDTEDKRSVKLPEGVSNRSGIYEVTVSVTLPKLEIRPYIIEQFRQVNAPEGLTVQLVTQKLEVNIRGRGPILDRIKPEDITAVVDLAGQEAGNVYLPVEIEIEGFGEGSNVGAVGKYSVQVKLIAPIPEEETTPAIPTIPTA